MNYRDLAQRLLIVPKNVPGVGDIVDAIKKGMQPKKQEPGQDYPKRVKVTT